MMNDFFHSLLKGNRIKMFSKTSLTPTGGEKSNGLGLYISRRIIEAHNGIIGYEENVNIGSTFYFKLKKQS